MAMAKSRGEHHHFADDGGSGRRRERIFYAVWRPWTDQPVVKLTAPPTDGICLAGGSALGLVADHFGRGLAVDAVDVPPGADRISKRPAQPVAGGVGVRSLTGSSFLSHRPAAQLAGLV